MANWNRNAESYSKPFEVALHFTQEELHAMEKKARGISRMDWTDKVKLIKQAQLALILVNDRK